MLAPKPTCGKSRNPSSPTTTGARPSTLTTPPGAPANSAPAHTLTSRNGHHNTTAIAATNSASYNASRPLKTLLMSCFSLFFRFFFLEFCCFCKASDKPGEGFEAFIVYNVWHLFICLYQDVFRVWFGRGFSHINRVVCELGGAKQTGEGGGEEGAGDVSLYACVWIFGAESVLGIRKTCCVIPFCK